MVSRETWRGRTVVIVCGGPSARAQPLDRIRGSGALVVGVNRCAEELPWVDAVFTVDGWWTRQRAEFLRTWPGTKLLAVKPDELPADAENVEHIRLLRGIGISDDPMECWEGGNSGFAATSLAAGRGAARIIMVGLDLTNPGHWHGGYDWRSRFNENCYPTWARAFDRLAVMIYRRGIRAVNVNPGSAVNGFPFATFDEVFPA